MYDDAKSTLTEDIFDIFTNCVASSDQEDKLESCEADQGVKSEIASVLGIDAGTLDNVGELVNKIKDEKLRKCEEDTSCKSVCLFKRDNETHVFACNVSNR